MAKIKLFIDTNIIIDLLADRQPFSNAAYEIFHKKNSDKWSLYTSSNSIITSFYIVEKEVGVTQANKAIETLLRRIEVKDIVKEDIVNAIKSKTEDLEDACQIECASKIANLNYIVTRDKKGFRNSKVQYLSADELINIH